jgi:TolB-like protein/tetratricopeptide (TPR) repeat protein/tRNA A-37 threonylcarbamoyl transferase component Bud32
MKCPKCQTDNPDTQKFCGECATPLTAAEESQPSITKTIETPREELTTGSTFADRYQIIEELGKGGMGNVYKANDSDIKEKVAIKLIKPEISTDKQTIERFQNELKFARKIRHKNVCQMYDLNREEGTYYITMEYVSGEDLKSFIHRSGQLTVGKTIAIAKQICAGLTEAHSLGVVHRDLKPSNIMIDKDGNARIMDFGIARSLSGKGITGAGVVIGTPQFMSPEQVEGKDVDQRTDIYSLGIILYKMLTNRVPFEGETPLTVGVKQKTEIPKDPKDFNDRIFEDLNRLILKCLEKEKENRYQNAAELRSDLDRLEQGLPTTERDVSPKRTATSKEATVTFQRRWMWAVVLFMFVALSVVGFLILKGGKDTTLQDRYWIVVLPFDNLGPPEDEYFAIGIAREIADRLSLIQELEIIAPTSAMQAKNASKTMGQIREEFGVDYIVTGTVQWEKSDVEKGQVLVTPELIKASDETLLWSDKITSSFENIISVQARIAVDVVRELDLNLLEPVREAIRDKPTENMEAYDEYLRAQAQRDKAWAIMEYPEFEKTIEMFKKAIDLDPEFIEAWLELSLTNLSIYYYGFDRSNKRLEKSRAALEKVDKIRPNYGRTKYFWAYYYYRGLQDNERAEELYESIQRILPNISTSLIGNIYAEQGRFDEALAALKRQAERDPYNSGAHTRIGNILTQMRRYAEAETRFDLLDSLDPGNSSTLMLKAINTAAWKGYSEAREILNLLPEGEIKKWAWIWLDTYGGRNYQEVLRLLDSLQLDSFGIHSVYCEKDFYYALTYHMLEDPALKKSHAESARQKLDDLSRKFPKDPKYHSALGFVYALLGQKEAALREGNRAVEQYPIDKNALWGTGYIHNLALILIIAEEYEEALDHLEYLMSIPAGKDVSITSLQQQPIYDPLRDMPRFKHLLEKYSQD